MEQELEQIQTDAQESVVNLNVAADSAAEQADREATAETPIEAQPDVDVDVEIPGDGDEEVKQDSQPDAPEAKASAAPALTQDQLLQIALKLFAEKGYFNTSLTDIKVAAGLKNTQAIYHFFKTKQAIAQALHENIFDSFSISIDDIRRRNRKASEQLREIVDLLFRLADDAPEILEFMLFTKTSEFLPEPKPLQDTPAFSKIKRIFQNAAKEGEIRSIDPLLSYTYFFGIIINTLSMVINGNLPKSPDSYQAQAWLAAWGCIAKK